MGTTKTIKKRGRPKKAFLDKYPTMLIKHMKTGLSFESFGAEIPCGKDLLYQWLKEYPEFSDAKKKGTSHSLKYWEQAGIHGMWAGQEFNATVWIFNLRNRFGWRNDTKDNEDEAADKNITIKLAYDPRQ